MSDISEESLINAVFFQEKSFKTVYKTYRLKSI